MSIWLLIVGMGLVSLGLRASFLVLLRGRQLPEHLRSSLGLVPAAVLAALIAPELLRSAATGILDVLNPRLLIGLIAAAVAWKTRNVLWTLVVGLGLLFVAQAIGWR
ncbi:AzlD domain-containing protein [Deinococcus sp. Arct2-2]|uniref:AzlD domain-containing protein n=1 Tax=Deinococcus sp. Arct2-2 TaxID=2568653 RepID=UPI0010A4C3D8|nr:AzlD domain-containing protein [Deinococcus sp. Arct2-2]THF66812.1 AzlD domain-containing protein [Deinococcus sp. Arct2-2]